MGILAAISAVVGIVGVSKQISESKKMRAAQKEASAVSSAGGLISDRAAKRRSAREERVRRARLLSTSRQNGAGNSSGELGGLGALTTLFDTAIADQSSERLTAEGISAANQKYADHASKYDSIGLWTKIIQQGLSAGQDAITAFKK